MKKILIIVVLIVIGLLVYVYVSNKNEVIVDEDVNNVLNLENLENLEEEPLLIEEEMAVKEFTMTSFVDMVDGKPKPQFSMKEIEVNKGDLVRLKITVTSGDHDFKIDEFDVYADTKLDEEYVVEFVADKTGEFEYYCTKPNHRANGHVGILRVLETETGV